MASTHAYHTCAHRHTRETEGDKQTEELGNNYLPDRGLYRSCVCEYAKIKYISQQAFEVGLSFSEWGTGAQWPP